MAAGVFSLSDNSRLAAILNRKRWNRKQGAGLAYPFRDASGDIVLRRVKPDNPQTRNGKPIKYLQPSGVPVRAFFPPGVRNKLKVAEQEVIVTEGEKKSLKAAQEGFPAIGLTGVECWHGKKSSALLPDLAAVSWKSRPVYIVFDSDAVDNPRVQENECLLGAALANEGADVKAVRLPFGPNGEKVGLDDFLVANGPGPLRKLMDEAEPPEKPDPESLKTAAFEMDAAVAVEIFLMGNTVDDIRTLRFWRGGYLRWRQGAYREVMPSEVRAEVLRFLNWH